MALVHVVLGAWYVLLCTSTHWVGNADVLTFQKHPMVVITLFFLPSSFSLRTSFFKHQPFSSLPLALPSSFSLSTFKLSFLPLCAPRLDPFFMTLILFTLSLPTQGTSSHTYCVKFSKKKRKEKKSSATKITSPTSTFGLVTSSALNYQIVILFRYLLFSFAVHRCCLEDTQPPSLDRQWPPKC